MTPKRKKLLVILIPVGVVVLAAAAALVIWLTAAPEEEKPFLILRDQDSNEIVSCTLSQGVPREQWESPENFLPIYSFTPPDGFQQTVDSTQTANRLSYQYRDEYQNQDGVKLVLIQRWAMEGTALKLPQDAQEVQFGQLQVIYYQGTGLDETSLWGISQEMEEGPYTGLYWKYGDTLLRLSCRQEMELNQMLEWMQQVDYQTLRQPVYTPLTVEAGYVQREEMEENHTLITSVNYHSQGNPEIPKELQYPGFSQIPEGYEVVEFYTQDGFTLYENQQGEVLALFCTPGSADFFNNGISYKTTVVNPIPSSELENQAAFAQVTVGGNPGFVHLGEDRSEIGWIDGCWTLQITATASLTQQELVELAESIPSSLDGSGE